MLNERLGQTQAFWLRVLSAIIFGAILGYITLATGSDIFGSNVSEIKHNFISDNKIALESICIFSVVIIIANAGQMRLLPLQLWLLLDLVIVGLISSYQDAKSPDAPLILWLVPVIFVLNSLLLSADIEKKFIASYNTYFDEAWKKALQLILGIIFCGMMWSILFLGSELLSIIGFDWFKELIKNKYFIYISSLLALAISVQVSDTQPKIIDGTRRLILSVLAWLLPLIVIIGIIFLSSLLFTGLQPLWDANKSSSSFIFSASAFFVLLINAAYQKGEDEKIINPALKASIKIGSLIILIFGLIAAYDLYIRTRQYGFTEIRLMGFIAAYINISYGLFYSLAIFTKNPFMNLIEKTNIIMAWIFAIIFTAILTPWGDLAKVGVNSQINMLKNGKVPVEKFDFGYLLWKSGKYGKDQVAILKKDPKYQSFIIAAESQDRFAYYQNQNKLSNPQANIVKVNMDKIEISPQDKAKLPKSFLEQSFDKSDYRLPACIINKTPNKDKCLLILKDINHDGNDEIIVAENMSSLFVLSYENNKWGSKNLSNYYNGSDLIDRLKGGDLKTQKPQWDDLVINGQTFRINQ